MSKALLQKNTRILLLWLPIVLIGCSILFFAMLQMQAHHMQERQLWLKQANIWAAFKSQSSAFPQAIWGEYALTEIPYVAPVDDEPRDTILYNQLQKENLPFEVVTGNYQWNGKAYQLLTFVSSREIHHLIIKVFLIEVVILVLLLLTVVVVNKKSSRSLWSPFFSTLQGIKKYDIVENKMLSLPATTGTTEFDELNKVLTSFVGNVNQAYYHQKQFVENASHEMQTPLAIIRSKLELLINQPELTEKAASLLGDITEANDRLSQVNRTLLLLAKIENHQFPEVENVDVSKLLQEIITTYRNHYEDGFPELNTNISPHVSVVANPSLMEVLLSNLIKNAVEHNQPNGKIIIDLNEQRLLLKNTGDALNIEPKELFERFQKGSHKSNTTGLGLALVKQIGLLYHFPITYTYQKGWHQVQIEWMKN